MLEKRRKFTGFSDSHLLSCTSNDMIKVIYYIYYMVKTVGKIADQHSSAWLFSNLGDKVQILVESTGQICPVVLYLFWTLSSGFESTHTFKCWSGIFPTILTYVIMLENCHTNFSVYGCSSIQGTTFYYCWNLMKPGSQSRTYEYFRSHINIGLLVLFINMSHGCFVITMIGTRDSLSFVTSFILAPSLCGASSRSGNGACCSQPCLLAHYMGLSCQKTILLYSDILLHHIFSFSLEFTLWYSIVLYYELLLGSLSNNILKQSFSIVIIK